jgi:hypothetical protein
VERYLIPRNIKVKEVVAYGLNGKQVLYLIAGIGGSILLWSAGIPTFGIAEKLAGSAICIGGGLSLSLAKVQGQELDRYLANTVRYPLRSKEFEGGKEGAKVIYTIRYNLG